MSRQRLGAAALGDRQSQRLKAIVLQHHVGNFVGHFREQRVALGEGELPVPHLAIERDLDVHFLVRTVDSRAIVDEVGVDPSAIEGELDPPSLGHAEVRTFADDLCPDFIAVGADRVVGGVANLAVRLGRSLDVSPDAAKPQEVHRRFQDRVHQGRGIDRRRVDSERRARLLR